MSLVVQLHRDTDDGKQTLGRLHVFEGNKSLFACKTLELPWKDNQTAVSCVPKGKYICKLTYSPAFKRNLYLVTDVPKRSGIRIHPANYYRQLKGCIALGSKYKDLDMDLELDLVHSGDTLKKFMELANSKDFILEIHNFTDVKY